MTTWLMDTPLLKMLASSRMATLRKWCEANDASLSLSAASQTEVMLAISKVPRGQSKRDELHKWLESLTERFADRIHVVDVEISLRAGVILPQVGAAHPLHRRHDAILVATARFYGHGLVTRRSGVFGDWTQTPILYEDDGVRRAHSGRSQSTRLRRN